MYIFFFVNTCRTCSTMYSLGRSIFCHNFHLGIARTFRQWRTWRMLFNFASLFSSSFLLIFLVFVAFLSFLQMERRIYRIIYIYIPEKNIIPEKHSQTRVEWQMVNEKTYRTKIFLVRLLIHYWKVWIII